jgi:hypothetical protein
MNILISFIFAAAMAQSGAASHPLIERIQKVDDNHMKWTVTYDDPVFFTEPWSVSRTFTRGKSTDRVMAYACEENNKDVDHLKNGTNKKGP